MTWMMRPTCTATERMRNHIRCYLRNLGPRRRGLGQRERHDVVPAWRAERAVAAGADDQILTLLRPGAVGHWCGLATRGQFVLPQLAAALDVEGAQVTVHGRGHEHQLAVGRDRAAHVRHAEVT